MIVINNLNKYYNKGKQNEVQAIVNTSVVFGEKGLTCLLGPSGCGKTTLLNCIGGMDVADSGTISYDGKILSKKQLDEFRAKEIGFVFQNYILLPNKTVYDNLRIVLNMFNLTESEIEEKIDFALKAVNMDKFKKRICKQLSGGQMQRVAIARALVKRPRLIIADEPTGNLDEKNTTQVMNLIKNLSKQCLVIMVTHEKRLADFYGDRIIYINDGRILNDKGNISKGKLIEKDDVNIYLGEMNSTEYLNDNININYFYENEKPELKLNIVFKNNTYYLKAETEDKKTIKFIDERSESLLISGKKPEIQIDDVIEETFIFPEIDKSNTSKSVISFKESLHLAKEFIKKLTISGKIKLFVFFLSAILIVTSIATFMKAINVDDLDVVNFSKEILVVRSEKELDVKDIKEKLNVPVLLPNLSNNYMIIQFDLYKSNNIEPYLCESTCLPVEYLEDDKIICGRIPQENNEIVIDAFLVEKSNEYYNNRLTQLGFESYNQLLGMEVQINDTSLKYTIVGISNYGDSSIFTTVNSLELIYLNNAMNYYFNSYINFDEDINYGDTNAIKFKELSSINNYFKYKFNKTNVIDLNSNPLQDNEVIISKQAYFRYVSNRDTINLLGKEFTAVGYFENDEDYIIANNNTIDAIYEEMIKQCGSFAILREDESKLTDILDEYTSHDIYELAIEEYKENNRILYYSRMVFTIITLSVSLIFLYFTVRSSLISRIYEVGTYRSLGAKKTDIYKLFSCEILLIIGISSFAGYLVGSIGVSLYENNDIVSMVYYPWYCWIISLVLIVSINLFVGLFPVAQLMQKTPAEIISKYDI